MKVRVIIITSLLIMLSVIIFTFQSSKKALFEQIEIEDLDKEFQHTINQIKEQNIYFIARGKTIILYSNLGKSGMYTYPYAEIKMARNKLIVDIKSRDAASEEYIKEILTVRLNIDHLPEEIEASFLDQKINYKVINIGR